MRASVCVLARGINPGDIRGFTPGNWAYISRLAYARLIKVVKTIDPIGVP